MLQAWACLHNATRSLGSFLIAPILCLFLSMCAKEKKKFYLLGSTNPSFRCHPHVVPVSYRCRTCHVMLCYKFSKNCLYCRVILVPVSMPCFLGYLFCKLLCLHNGHMTCIQILNFMLPCYHFRSMRSGSLVQLIKKDKKNSC